MDIHSFETSTQQVLAALLGLADATGEWTTSLAISRYLHDDFGINIHWRTIDSLLDKDRRLASRRKRQGRWEYKILDAGRASIVVKDEAVSFVNPSTALQSTLKLHDVLARLKGIVRVCDPYLDHLTIEHLEACGSGRAIQVLTQKINDSGPLRRIVEAARIAGHLIEIRVVSSKTLHDRYVIDDDSMLILGGSLNGFGKKQSFVIQAGTDIRNTMLSVFEDQWANAVAWP